MSTVFDVNNTEDVSLYDACKNNNVEITKFYIDNGANINSHSPVYGFACRGDTPAEIAGRYGNIDILKLLYEKGGISVLDGALHRACINGNIDVIDYLINLNVPLDKQCAKYFTTPLIEACKNSNIDAVMRLLNAGASINFQSRCGPAIYHTSNSQIIDILYFYGCDVNIQNYRGTTPLMSFVEKFRPNIKDMEKLIEYGASLDIQDTIGNTALIIAARLKKYKIIKFLLDNGANPNIKNNEGKSYDKYLSIP